MTNGLKKWTGLVVIIVAAVLLEALSAIQYNFSHSQLEKALEHNALMNLTTSALRVQEVLSTAEIAVNNELLHAEESLDDPDYMYTIITNLVSNDEDNLDGAFVCFKPNYFPSKGYWYEPYARQRDGKIDVVQIGSADHDYTQRDYYRAAMRGDTIAWSQPYMDEDGARTSVITYVVPIRDKGETVGAIGVDLTTEWINDVVNINHQQPSTFTMVLTEDGKLISCPDESAVRPDLVEQLVAMYNDSTVDKELTGHGRITRYTFYDKARKEAGRVYFARKRYAPHWQMLVVCYDKEVFGQLDTMRRYMLWISLAGLAILALIIWLFVRSNRALQATQLSQERLNSELRVAKNIQQQILPAANSVQRADISICGSLLPAREVGGDLYDYFVRNEKLFFAIGDVSGKGIPAAMMMAQTMSLLRASGGHDTNPAHVMKVLNNAFCHGNESNMFITLLIGVLDLPTGLLRYCNAGHCPPICISRTINELEAKPNMPVGVFADTDYVAHEYLMPADSTLFLYTDGLTEARNSSRQFFGAERLMEQLQKSEKADVKEKIENMAAAIQSFAQGAEQSDDLTMLAFHYTPQQENDILNERLTLTNDLQQVELVGKFIKEIGARLGMEAKTIGEIRLAIEEAIVNVMHYAYPSGSTGNLITLDAKADGQTLTLILTDSGSAFDPTEAQDIDTSLSAEERPIGGLGIHLIRQLSDSINYEREKGKNILTIKKHYEHND